MVSSMCLIGEATVPSYENTHRGIAGTVFGSMIKVHNQVTLVKGDYPG